MIFELSHENITTALREYMDRRNIINGKDFTFQMKTSRKGEKTSRAIITTVDTLVAPVVETPVVAHVMVMEPPLDIPMGNTATVVVEEVSTEENSESKNTPFKKLFAA